MHNLEVTDESKASALFVDFLTKQQIKNKNILILLNDSVLFEKNIPLLPGTEEASLSDEFISKVPFTTQYRAILRVLQAEKQLTIYATNAALYYPLAMACKNLKNKVIAVSPAATFGLGAHKNYTKDELKHLFKDVSLAREANFLQKF